MKPGDAGGAGAHGTFLAGTLRGRCGAAAVAAAGWELLIGDSRRPRPFCFGRFCERGRKRGWRCRITESPVYCRAFFIIIVISPFFFFFLVYFLTQG